VAVIGFELSAAFNTVGREDLLPKMLTMGIGGKVLKWFCCYLTNAKQRVVWDRQVSDIVDVEYGVRQGSLLGLVHTFFTSSTFPSPWRSGSLTATAPTPMTRLFGFLRRTSRRRSESYSD
jgi:hypothetical protein